MPDEMTRGNNSLSWGKTKTCKKKKKKKKEEGRNERDKRQGEMLIIRGGEERMKCFEGGQGVICWKGFC